MANYHINPETGEPGICRAKKNCPFGNLDSHYSSKEEAIEDFEAQMKREELIALGNYSSSPSTLHALNSSLKYEGPTPKWLKEQNKLSMKLFGTEAEIIDIIDAPIGTLFVTWEKNSTSDNDISIEIERGFNVSRIVYTDLDGNEKGYLKAGYTSENSIARSWGNDNWSGLCYAQEYLGSNFGMIDDFDTSREDRTYKANYSPINEKDTDEERIEKKKEVWVKAHQGFKLLPEGFDSSKLMWGNPINLTKDHAPEDEEMLDKDLKVLQEKPQEALKNFTKSHSIPIIDFVSLNNEIKSKGMGPSLYIYAARKLAEQGLTLAESGLQTEFAEAVWSRMMRDKNIPKTLVKKIYKNKSYKSVQTRASLDFR